MRGVETSLLFEPNGRCSRTEQKGYKRKANLVLGLIGKLEIRRAIEGIHHVRKKSRMAQGGQVDL